MPSNSYFCSYRKTFPNFFVDIPVPSVPHSQPPAEGRGRLSRNMAIRLAVGRLSRANSAIRVLRSASPRLYHDVSFTSASRSLFSLLLFLALGLWLEGHCRRRHRDYFPLYVKELICFKIYFVYFVQNIIDHYENPRNVGSLDKSADDVGTVSSLHPARASPLRQPPLYFLSSCFSAYISLRYAGPSWCSCVW